MRKAWISTLAALIAVGAVSCGPPSASSGDGNTPQDTEAPSQEQDGADTSLPVDAIEFTPDTGPGADIAAAIDGDSGLDPSDELDERDAESPPWISQSGELVGAAGARLVVDAEAGEIALRRDEQLLLRLGSHDFKWARVEALNPNLSYSPTAFFLPVSLEALPDVEWIEAERLTVVAEEPPSFERPGGGLRVALDYGNAGQGEIEIWVHKSAFAFRWTAIPSAGELAIYRLGARIDPTEGLYGIGETFDSVDHRGKVRPMQIEVDFELDSSYNEVHVPIPLVLGTVGWGLYVSDAHPAAFDLAAASPHRIEAAFSTTIDSADGLLFYLFSEPNPLDLTRHYYEITGAPALPPPWALGPLLWRDENRDQAEIESDALTMRQLGLPCTGLWIDRPYATAVNTFDFSASMFTNPAAMVNLLHDLGYTWSLWHTPYLDTKSSATEALRNEATQKGFYPPVSSVPLNPWGPLLDLSNPAARSFWQDNLAPYVNLHVAGYKLDYAEDVVPSLLGARVPWEFWDGTTERTMHARYQQYYHATYHATVGRDESGHVAPFLLVRHANPGSQTLGVVVWPGDLDVTFGRHREPVVVKGKTVLGVGGLPAAVVASMGLGPSGFAFFGSDTGGYKYGPPDKELFTRWAQHTAFSVVMQVGTGDSTVPWEFDEATGYDAEMLDWYRTYATEHIRLFPYLWTYAQALPMTGRAILRPLGLAYPALGQHPDDQYMLGDSLLVAPVVERGARARSLHFPPGSWEDWWTGQRREGGMFARVAAPLDTIPVFLAAGGIVPRLRSTVQTLNPVNDASLVDSAATSAGPLFARVAPGPSSSFTVYDGATLAQTAAESRGIEYLSLSFDEGDTYKGAAIIELVGPSSVWSLGELPEVANLAALTDYESAAAFVDDSQNRLFVRVLSGQPVTLSRIID